MSWLSAGIAAVGGAIQNISAGREADKNRRFQERMSSTAAQRSVEDFRKAGLNPALAYERTASTPGGSVAPVEDVGAKVVSSALAAKQMQANVELTKAQTAKVNAESAMLGTDLSLRTTSTEGQPTWRDAQIAERVARLRDLAHQGVLQPHDERLRALAVLMQRELLKRTSTIGETFEDADRARDALRTFMERGFSSASEAKKALDAWSEALRANVREADSAWSRSGWKPSADRGVVGAAKRVIPKSLTRR